MTGDGRIDLQDCEKSVKFRQWRVRSFAWDPLLSAAYLQDLHCFLSKPFWKQAKQLRHPVFPPTSPHESCFLYSYPINTTRPSSPTRYTKIEAIFSQPDLDPSKTQFGKLIVLTGYPSAEWLNAIVTR